MTSIWDDQGQSLRDLQGLLTAEVHNDQRALEVMLEPLHDDVNRSLRVLLWATDIIRKQILVEADLHGMEVEEYMQDHLFPFWHRMLEEGDAP